MKKNKEKISELLKNSENLRNIELLENDEELENIQNDLKKSFDDNIKKNPSIDKLIEIDVLSCNKDITTNISEVMVHRLEKNIHENKNSNKIDYGVVDETINNIDMSSLETIKSDELIKNKIKNEVNQKLEVKKNGLNKNPVNNAKSFISIRQKQKIEEELKNLDTYINKNVIKTNNEYKLVDSTNNNEYTKMFAKEIIDQINSEKNKLKQEMINKVTNDAIISKHIDS